MEHTQVPVVIMKLYDKVMMVVLTGMMVVVIQQNKMVAVVELVL
jgi:hypothetical protein